MAYACLPPVRLTLGAFLTNPVGLLVTVAFELAGVQTSRAICLPVPKLHDLRLTLSKDRMALLCANSLLDTVALRAPCFSVSSSADCYCPFMPKLTLPNSSLVAVDHEVVWAELILVAPLSSDSRCMCRQGVVVANSSTCTVGAACAARPAVNSCLPIVSMAIWALVAFPPHFLAAARLDENVAKMSILAVIPLAAQQWAEQAKVWALLLLIWTADW